MKTRQSNKTWSSRAVMMGGMGLFLSSVVSCGTGASSTRPVAGAAMLDAKAGKHHQSRMKKSRVISVNGVGKAGREAHVAIGLTTATVRYNWPQGGAQEVDLKFKAVSDRKYFVKYAAFPPTVDQFRGTTMLSTTANAIAGSAYKVMASGGGSEAGVLTAAVGTVVLSPAIVLGTMDFVHRAGQEIKEQHKPAQWVDMMVISEVKSEGVVRFVRVYPSGHVDWKPWDVASNAPGNAQRGRALNSRPMIASNGPNGPADNTFQRQKSTEE